MIGTLQRSALVENHCKGFLCNTLPCPLVTKTNQIDYVYGKVFSLLVRQGESVAVNQQKKHTNNLGQCVYYHCGMDCTRDATFNHRVGYDSSPKRSVLGRSTAKKYDLQMIRSLGQVRHNLSCHDHNVYPIYRIC